MKKLSRNQRRHRDYLMSEKWAKIRCDILLDADFKCFVCGKKSKYNQVHHLSYHNWMEEEPDDLVVLCRKCHVKAHGILSISNSQGSRWNNTAGKFDKNKKQDKRQKKRRAKHRRKALKKRINKKMNNVPAGCSKVRQIPISEYDGPVIRVRKKANNRPQ